MISPNKEFKSGIFILILMITLSFKTETPANMNPYISIENGLKQGLLQVKIKSLGAYQENCVEFEVKNNTADTLFVQLEPGRRLLSSDSTKQDLLIVKKKEIKLCPYANKTFTGNGFCCQCKRNGPTKELKYAIGYMAPPDWIKLANVISENKFPTGAIQSAVWVLSDHHLIGSVYDKKMESIYLLRRTLAEIKGVEIPWYAISYEKDSLALFSGRPDSIEGEFNYYLKNNSMVNIQIRDKNGKIMARLINGIAMGPGSYNYNLDLKIHGWPKGEYKVYVFEDNVVLNKIKTFII